MRVVLPEPLAPTTPKTAPRGTLRLSWSRARFARKRRDSRSTRTTASAPSGGVSVMVLFLLALARDFVALPDQVEKVFDANVQEPDLGEQGVDALGQGVEALLAGHARGAGRDVGA